MNPNSQQPLDIDIKDLILVLFRRIGVAILVGISMAILLASYKYISNQNDNNVLDISAKLDGESDVDFLERVSAVNRAEDIINSSNALTSQIEIQREYVANSVLMQLDFSNESVTTAQLVITIDDNLANGMDNALASSYAQDLIAGEYLSELSDELGTKQEYLKELIKVTYDTSTSVVVNTDGTSESVGTINITVVGPTTEYTNLVMDCMLDEVNYLYGCLNETVVPHSVTIAGRQSYYMVDVNTRDLQYNAANRFEALQKQIETYEDSLDEVASDLGVSKGNLYAFFSFNDDSWMNSGTALGALLKYAAIGFALGVFVVMVITSVDYIFGKRFITQAKLFARFPRLNKIGVVKPICKRSSYIKFIDRKTGDDDKLSDENSTKLLAANIRNLLSGKNKVLFTGTAEISRIKELVKALCVDADVKESFFVDPSCLEDISKYDGVIIVEQRKHSDCNLIAEELNLIGNADTELIGAIVI